jgi:hypothetical protein
MRWAAGKRRLAEQRAVVTLHQPDRGAERREVARGHIEDGLLELEAEPFGSGQLPEDRETNDLSRAPAISVWLYGPALGSGNDHVDLAAAAIGAHGPGTTLEDSRLGAVALGHLGRVGLDVVLTSLQTPEAHARSCCVTSVIGGPSSGFTRRLYRVLIGGSSLLDIDELSVARTAVAHAGSVGFRLLASTEGKSTA